MEESDQPKLDVYIIIYIYIYMISVYIYIHMICYIYIYTCVYLYIYIYVFTITMITSMYVCMHVCMYVCMYVYLYKPKYFRGIWGWDIIVYTRISSQYHEIIKSSGRITKTDLWPPDGIGVAKNKMTELLSLVSSNSARITIYSPDAPCQATPAFAFPSLTLVYFLVHWGAAVM